MDAEHHPIFVQGFLPAQAMENNELKGSEANTFRWRAEEKRRKKRSKNLQLQREQHLSDPLGPAHVLECRELPALLSSGRARQRQSRQEFAAFPLGLMPAVPLRLIELGWDSELCWGGRGADCSELLGRRFGTATGIQAHPLGQLNLPGQRHHFPQLHLN
ncbi:hypothetical protein DV515_00016113 [Chloebia gouldiae]|uniref:Uncharacterized protein n=1 Tax=Chloebia gouldiae TaxID=44316 RepID=A0A3L8RTL9_CHLGU|nr:hypothetical protein DV515_00016113 [Chloebia gouldiae]